jgi:glyoxylase-like metal-dependent hydrolase (beta-lactamase superfamily II)/kynurenine formamidase
MSLAPYEENDTGYRDPELRTRMHVEIGDMRYGHPNEYCVTELTLGAHHGTHLDAPAHFIVDSARLGSLDTERLAGWVVPVDIPKEPSAVELEWLQRIGAHLRENEIPVLRWSGTLLPEVAKIIADWPTPLLVMASSGIDRSELTRQGHYPNYKHLMGCGKFLVVELSGGEHLQRGDYIVVAPLALSELEAAPCRILAIRGLGSAWFEIERIAAGVYSLAEPGHREYVRSYLVLGNREAALIDTGMGIDDIQREVERLTSLPIRIILTHAHWDHAGGILKFPDSDVMYYADEGDPQRKRLSQRERLMRGWSHKELADDMRPKKFGRPWPSSCIPGEFRIPKIEYEERLMPVKHGDLIDLGSRVLEVLHTPGHSPGSICLWDEANGLLFSGDTFYLGPLYGYAGEFSLEDYRETAEKLCRKLCDCGQSAVRVLPGHNEIELNDEGITAADFAQLRDALRQIEERSVEGSLKQPYEFPRFAIEISMDKR